MYEQKPLPFEKELEGISKKTIEIHHGKLYKGYVDKSNEISEKLGVLRKSGKVEAGTGLDTREFALYTIRGTG